MAHEVRLASGGSGGSSTKDLKLRNGTFAFSVGSGGRGRAIYSESLGLSSGTSAGSGGCTSFAGLLTASGGGGGTAYFGGVAGGSAGSPNGSRGNHFAMDGSNERMSQLSFSRGSVAGGLMAGSGGGCSAHYPTTFSASNGGTGGVKVTYLGPLEVGDDPQG